jgi:hypothetical protein
MKKILMTSMALILILGLIGVGVSAIFWDEETSGVSAIFWDEETSGGNTFTAGTLDLKVDGSDDYFGIWSYASPPEGLQPQDFGEHTFVLNNTGSLPGLLSITVLAYTEDGGGPPFGPGNPEPEMVAEGTDYGSGEVCAGPPCNEPNLDDELTIMLWQEADGNNIYNPGPDETILLQGIVSDVLSKVSDTLILTGYNLAAGGNTNLGFAWEVGDDPTAKYPPNINKIMGDNVYFDIYFYLEQVVGTPAALSIINGSKAHAGAVFTGDIVAINATLENTGSIPGVGNVNLTVLDGGSPVYTDSDTVVVPGLGTAPVLFNWDTGLTGAGSFSVTVDLDANLPDWPADSEGVFYRNPAPGPGDTTTRVRTLTAKGVLPARQYTGNATPPSSPPPPAVLSDRYDELYSITPPEPIVHRYPWPPIGGPDNFQKTGGEFNSVDPGSVPVMLGEPQYGWISGDVFGGTNNLELEYTRVGYAQTAGTTIGLTDPGTGYQNRFYTVGDEWSFTLHREIWAFNNIAQYLTFSEERRVVAVGATPPAVSIGRAGVAGGEPVTAYAQTFSDCAVIELYRDPDPTTGVAGLGLRQIAYWSPTVNNNVYIEEFQFYDFEQFSLLSDALIIA